MEIFQPRFRQSRPIAARCAESRKTMSKQPKLTKAQFRMDRRQLLSGLASSGLILSGVHHAFGQTRVPVTGGEVAPLPIAIPNFVAGSPADGEVGVGVAQVITNNLNRSRSFAQINQPPHLEKILKIHAVPQYANRKNTNV